jgi:hypothetical protein
MNATHATTSLAALLSIGLLGIVQSAQAHQCTLADAAGRFGYAQTTSIAGNLVDETVQGTYTVNADCTGAATVYVYHGSVLARVSHINLVWDAHQNEARAIFLNPGTNISIEARRITEDE